METNVLDSSATLDQKVKFYHERLAQIDRMLQGPVRTLFKYACQAIIDEDRSYGNPASANSGKRIQGPPRFPVTLSEEPVEFSSDSTITTALCLNTAIRLWEIRRRFPWLEPEKLLPDDFLTLFSTRYLRREDGTTARSAYGEESNEAASTRYFERCCELLDSDTFGLLNPLTASQVFRLLMRLAEEHAHDGTGSLALFSLTWALKRPGGPRTDPSEPTAYVAAKCLLPLIQLQSKCEQRKVLYERVRKNLAELGKLRDVRYGNWRYIAEADDLRRNIAELAGLSLSRGGFNDCQEAIGRLLEEAGASEDVDHLRFLHSKIISEIGDALHKVRTTVDDTCKRASAIHKELRERLIKPLGEATRDLSKIQPQPHSEERSRSTTGRYILPNDIKDWNFRFLPQANRHLSRNPKHLGKRLQEIYEAAEASIELGGRIVNALSAAATIKLSGDDLIPDIDKLIDANLNVAKELTPLIQNNAEWCATILNREIAFASANNFTDYDAAELLSALDVVIRAGRLESKIQVQDAVHKALLGVQRDGSWRLGHSYYSPDGLSGIRPASADVVWNLTMAISEHPEITLADDALFDFVNWLERMERRIKGNERNATDEYEAKYEQPQAEIQARNRMGDLEGLSAQDAKTAKDLNSIRDYMAAIADKPEVGWPVDRIRHPGQIHLATTAYAVNALLSIRNLVEERLWQLCEERFTIVPEGISLKEMDPVDLMSPYSHRIHTVLKEISRSAQNGEKSATYSLVLHGPPGSSKTAVAGALAQEMWKTTRRWKEGQTRLIRITPADFTRAGEDRVDSEAQLIFRLLGSVRGVTILFDEIDDLLSRRDNSPGKERIRFLDLVTPGMLNRLQDLRDVCNRQEICFLFGTNYVDKIEPALMRQGRIDKKLPVVYPDHESRLALASKIFRGPHSPKWAAAAKDDWETLKETACSTMAKKAAGLPWNAYTLLCTRWAKELSELPQGASNQRLEKSFNDTVANQVEFRSAIANLESDYVARLTHRPCSELRMEYLHYLIGRKSGNIDEVLKEVRKTIRGIQEPNGWNTLKTDLLKDSRALPHMQARSVRRGIQAKNT